MKNLPERWCIQRNPENYKELNPLLKLINGKNYIGNGVNAFHNEDYFHNQPATGKKYIYSYPRTGYTKITLEQLKASLEDSYTLQDFIQGRVVLERPHQQDQLLNSFMKEINPENQNVSAYRTDSYLGIDPSNKKWFKTSNPDNLPVVKDIKDLYKNEKMNSNKKIIGYNPKKEFFDVTVACFALHFDHDAEYFTNTLESNREEFGYEIATDSLCTNYLVKLKVLDLWCEPVYEDNTKLPVINGYKGELVNGYIKYGCANIPVEWFTSSNREITSMTLSSGVVISQNDTERIRKYLRKNI